MPTPPSLVWFRQDLRLADNPALRAAVQRGGPVIPVFIWAPTEAGGWAPGSASRWWLHQTLASLEARLRQRGSRLVLRQGESVSALEALVRDTGAGAIFWNRRYEPAPRFTEARLTAHCRALGVHVESYNSSYAAFLTRSSAGNAT